MHTYHELFEAAARGEANEFEAKHKACAGHECAENFLNSIYICPDEWTVRRKRRTHNVNGWEVPAPMASTPEEDEVYWVEAADDLKWAFMAYWINSRTDKVCLARGICHATEEGAAQNAKARYGVDPFAEGEGS